MNEPEKVVVVCHFSTGRTAITVARLVQDRLDDPDCPPWAVWCEPVNGRAPINGFIGLGKAKTVADMLRSSSPLLCEARLFFPMGMLHLLAAGEHVRWAAWWEGPPSVPRWCPENGSLPQSAEMLCRTRPILLRGSPSAQADTIDRGLQGASGLGRCVTAIEYYYGTTLRWWSLEPHDTA